MPAAGLIFAAGPILLHEPNEASLQRLDTWHSAVESFPKGTAD